VARGPHKVAHPTCAFPSWSACDKAEKVRFGQCKAMVGDKDPVPCTRWAVSEDGWCWQHYSTEKDRIAKEAEKQLRQFQFQQEVDRYNAWRKDHPSVWDFPPGIRLPPPSDASTVGLAGVPPYCDCCKVVGVKPTQRKGPHQLAELA
jgi:hypothetical protein